MQTDKLDAKYQEARPKARPYSIADGDGLYLLVTPSGGKLWRWGYRFQGKQKLMSFGTFPKVSLAQARVLHTEARALRATGVDPMAQRKKQKTIMCASAAMKNYLLPKSEQERFQKLYASEQERLQKLYASENERLEQVHTHEDESVIKKAFDALVEYLLALKIKPTTIQAELSRRKTL